MKRFGESKKGSQLVEASILAPVFLAAILLIGTCIDAARQHEDQWHRLLWQINEKQHLSQSASKMEGIATSLMPISEENGTDVVREMLQSDRTDRTVYTLHIPIDLLDDQTRTFTASATYHLFTGKQGKGRGCGFEELETDSESSVWVFPKRGERYHEKNCRIVTVYPLQFVLSEAIRKQYEPCTICDPQSLLNGTPVYCFATGHVYHKKSCPQVERYVIPMSKEEAAEKGYLPCQYCQSRVP